MQEWRFKQIKKFIPFMFEDPLLQDVDPWWRFVSACHQFNSNRQTTVAASVHKTFDEFMSAYKPRTTRTGGLPHLSYIERKPEPLGTEFKNVACGLTGMFIGMELQWGSSDTAGPDNEDLGTCSAVSLCLSRLGKQCGQVCDMALFYFYLNVTMLMTYSFASTFCRMLSLKTQMPNSQ